MTREIKFRAWDGKEMLDWEKMCRDTMNTTFSINSHKKVMQFTGLKDKNGKEIYEGDIVKYKELEGFACERDDWETDSSAVERIGKVEFIDGAFTPRDYYHYVEDGYYAYRRFGFEIIGNVWENPELLIPNPKQ